MDSAIATPSLSPTVVPTGSPAAAPKLANVLYEKKGAVAYVTVNRPKVLNALNMSAWADLRTAFEDTRDDATVRGANGMDPALPARATIGCQLHRGRNVMQIVRIGLDLAKYVLEIHGVDSHGNTVLRKTLRRHAVSVFFANLPPCLIGLEASNGAHFWAKALSDLGHDVRLISPQFVTPYVKSNKNDRNDAEAICEAVGRPNMRFVPVKSAEQLAVQAVHRICSRLVADRVRLVNQVRGLLGEHGIVVAKDIGNLRPRLSQGSLATMRTGFSKVLWFAR